MITPYWTSPFTVTDLVDWGIIPTMIEGESRTSGKLGVLNDHRTDLQSPLQIFSHH